MELPNGYSEDVLDYKEKIDEAKDEIEKGHYASAIITLNKILEHNPNINDAYLLRGQAKFEMEDYKDALTDSNYLLLIDDENVDNLYFNAQLKVMLGLFSEAEIVIKSIFKINDHHTKAYLLLSGIKLAQGETEKAIELVNIAIDIDPDNNDAVLQRGMIFSAMGTKTEAASDFEKHDPNNIKVRSILFEHNGMNNLFDGKYLSAISNFERVIGINNKNPIGYFGLASAKWQIGDPTAEEDILQAIKCSESMPAMQGGILNLYINIVLRKDITRALIIAEQAAKEMPDSSMIWESLSWVQFLKGHLNYALESITRSITLDGKNHHALFLRSSYHYFLNNHKETETDYFDAANIFSELFPSFTPLQYGEILFQISDKDPQILFIRACFAYKIKNKEEAVKYFDLAYKFGHPFTASQAVEFMEKNITMNRHSNDDGELNKSELSQARNASKNSLLKQLIKSEFSDVIKPGKTVPGTVRRKLLKRMREIHGIDMGEKTLGVYLGRMDFARYTERELDPEYSKMPK